MCKNENPAAEVIGTGIRGRDAGDPEHIAAREKVLRIARGHTDAHDVADEEWGEGCQPLSLS